MNRNASAIYRQSAYTLRKRGSALLALACAFAAHANAATGGTLPWEKPMTLIATSLTGPVAYAIGLIGIAIAGGAMLLGRRTDRVWPSCLHDRPRGFGARVRRADALHSLRRKRSGDLNEHGQHRQASRDHDSPVRKPTESIARRRPRTRAGDDHDHWRACLQPCQLVGHWVGGVPLDRVNGGLTAHG